ncbi:MAG: hypothetical protein KF788_06670 [Piscinibacter sp.]|nr:hypothetical protein [Piscinibacter sp.]
MSEWWTYRLSDFLLFAPRTYWRQIELLNLAAWPAQWLLAGLGVGLAAVLAAGGPRLRGIAMLVAAVLWGCVAWAFLWQRYAGIHWLAPWFAFAFALQGLVFLGAARRTRQSHPGAALLTLAVLAYPAAGLLAGRPWSQAEVFGLAPDPTVIGSFGLLLALPRRPMAWWAAWAVPLGWCAVSGATLWAMEDPLAALPPCAAFAALLLARLSSRTDPASTTPSRAARP